VGKNLRRLSAIVATALVVIGFRLATQTGLTGAAGSIQNDGYAVSGGILILVGGLADGYIIAKAKQKK